MTREWRPLPEVATRSSRSDGSRRDRIARADASVALAAIPPESPSTSATFECGLTLAAYAAAKRLDVGMLNALGLRDARWPTSRGRPAVRIPYLNQAGQELAVRYRIALTGDRFRWRRGDRPRPYGLHRLHVARTNGFVILVEGESDCHAAWLHNVPALGIPGAAVWKPTWVEQLEGIAQVFVVVEPDQGGHSLSAKLGESLGGRLRLVRDLGLKDLAELHLRDPEHFVERLEHGKATATVYRHGEIDAGEVPIKESAAKAGRRPWRDRWGHLHLPPIEVSL